MNQKQLQSPKAEINSGDHTVKGQQEEKWQQNLIQRTILLFFFFLLPDQCRKKQFKRIILHSSSKLGNLKDSSAPGPIK